MCSYPRSGGSTAGLITQECSLSIARPDLESSESSIQHFPALYHSFVDRMAQSGPTTPPMRCLGPVYRSESQKPAATISKDVPFENVHVLLQSPQLIALLT